MNIDRYIISQPSIERGYRLISDYALVGDCRTAALVASDASVDWLCLPFFDSEAQLSRIIGAPRGGYWSITSADGEAVPRSIRQHYEPDTAVLETIIGLDEGELAITDFMATAHLRGNEREMPAPCLIRQITAMSQPSRFAVHLKIAPDYGRQLPRITLNGEGIIAVGDQGAMVVSYLDGGGCTDLQDHTPSGPVATLHTLQPGERMTLALSWAPNPHQASRLRRDLLRRDWDAEKAATIAFWQGWSAQTYHDGPYRDLIARSAITLKLLSFAPTGAYVAAPTTSLPEEIGGHRNWDYRYCWIRDGSMTATALALVGHVDEARAFVQWVEHRERETADELRVLYGIQGERETPEAEVPPLEGYEQSTPVRIGNKAVGQQQHDLYGEWLDCVSHVYLRPDAPKPDRWLASLVDASVTHVCDFWMEPDAGIWEVRSKPQNFVHSKMMCWIAMDRGIKLAEHFGWDVDIDRWQRVRDNIHDDVWTHGRDPQSGRWRISYEYSGLDASVMMAILMGFVSPNDPSVLATIKDIMDSLTDKHGFVYRYRQFDDGVGGAEGTFVMCSCWLAEILAEQGHVEVATHLFEHILAHVSPTGLLSEMLDPETGRLVGNYPQAFSHLSLIRVALALAKAGKETTPLPQK